MTGNYIDTPFAVDGDLTPVPDSVQPDGSISFPQGYGPNYSLDPESNPTALLIERTKFNYLMNFITTQLQQYQQHATPDFITDTENGGSAYSYSNYDRVRYDPGTGHPVVYQSLKDSNTDLPTVTASWGIVSVTNSGIPRNAQAGGTYNPVAADLGKIITRSNSTSAMTDTLPGVSGALPAAWFAYFQNTDATANDTIGVGGSGSIRVGSDTGSNFFVIRPGEVWLVVSFGGGAYTASLVSTATRPLIPSSNLSDLASIPTALTNLGFSNSLGASGYQIFPGGLILQWAPLAVGSGGVTWTLPVTFPNACVFADGVITGSAASGADDVIYATLSTSAIGFDYPSINTHNIVAFAVGY